MPLTPDPGRLRPSLQASSLHQRLFVGREREFATLQTTLGKATGERGRLVLIAGESGIGKTRLADEFATFAQSQNIPVLWGRCWEGGGAPTFWPWVQIVRAYLSRCDQNALVADINGEAVIIAQIVSEVRERLPDLPTPPELEPAHARFRFFDSLAT